MNKYTLTKDSYIYSMSSENAPALRVPSGSIVEIETYDCFQNQIQDETFNMDALDWNRINPATGPVYVEGAEPGDILQVEIQKIDIASFGTMLTGENAGVMGHRLKGFSVKRVPIRDGKVIFNDKIEFPVNPMVGVIGVAPKEGSINCGTPGDHGGNMDTIMIGENATVYFPVFHEGALFSLGDCHAAMGDGEVGVSGIEVPAKVTVKISVIKGESIRTPVVETDEGIACIVSKETLDEAAVVATEEMVEYLMDRTGMAMDEATMLLSAAGHLQISQVVDPLKTVRMYVPKSILRAYGVEKVF